MLFPLMFLTSIYVARQKTKLSASFHERLGVDTWFALMPLKS